MRTTSRRSHGKMSLGTGLWQTSLAALATWMITPAAADKSAADYYVHSLPGQPEGPLLKMHAG